MNSADASGNPMEQIAKLVGAMKPAAGGARKTRKAGKTPAVGTKAQVWHGTAKHTSGGLTRKDLMKTKKGRIVSRKKHAAGKRALSRLRKAGFVAKKGTFRLFKK
jgi:hypothetical protein